MERCDHSSEKQEPGAYHDHTRPGLKCTVDYICPPDWCHVIRDVASASELWGADKLPLRSVTMSIPSCCAQVASVHDDIRRIVRGRS